MGGKMKYVTSWLIVAYNLTIVAGTAYLVQFYDWSMWTFLLAGLFLMSYRDKNETDTGSGSNKQSTM